MGALHVGRLLIPLFLSFFGGRIRRRGRIEFINTLTGGSGLRGKAKKHIGKVTWRD